MTPEEKSKAMKLHLSSMYGKMTTESLYADTDSIKKAPKQDALIKYAKTAILELNYKSCYVDNHIEIYMTRQRFNEFCYCLISLLEKCEVK